MDPAITSILIVAIPNLMTALGAYLMHRTSASKAQLQELESKAAGAVATLDSKTQRWEDREQAMQHQIDDLSAKLLAERERAIASHDRAIEREDELRREIRELEDKIQELERMIAEHHSKGARA